MVTTATTAPPAPAPRSGRRRRSWVSVAWPLAYGLYVAVWAVLFLRHNLDYGLDDSYISYRYAQNLADGHGLAFNVGERFFGTTAAGYATFLGLMHMATGVAIPHLSVAATAGGVSAFAAGLPSLARGVPGARRWLLSALFATAAFVLPPFNHVAGHETVAFLGVAFLGTMCLTHWTRPLLAGVLLAVATTFRPDVVLLAAVAPMALWVVAGGGLGGLLRSRSLWSYVVGYAVPLLLWLVFLLRQFGTVVPGTLDAKRAQVGLGYWPIFGFDQVRLHLTGSLGGLALGILVAGLIASVLRPGRPAAGLLLAWLGFALGGAAFYTLSSVTFWPWYATPAFFTLLLAAFVGWANLTRLSWGWAAILVLVVALVANLSSIGHWLDTPNTNAHIHAYDQAADYIAAHSPDGASILMPEPGSFGYNLGPKYTVVDELGLVSPGVAAALLRADTSWAFRTYRPDYLICSWHGSYTACDQRLHKQGYALVGEFDTRFWKRHIKHGARLYVREGSG